MRLVRITALASVWLTLLVLVSLGIVHPGTIRAQPSPSDLSPRVDSDQDRIVDALEADFARARPQDALPVIVVLRDRLDSGTLDHLRQRVGDFPVPFQYPGASAFAARLTRGQARALADSGLVAHIEPDSPVTASIDSAIYWSGVQQGRQDFGLSGSGVNIAIIDSGINPNHPDLSGKIVKWTDVITGSTIPHDGCAIRHGTMVASVAAGTGAASQGRYAGIAPGAGLVVVKALNDVTVNGQPFCTTSVSIVNAAIQWVIDNRAAYNIRVLNLSVGTLDSCNADNNQSTVRLVNQATSLGIVPVIAAGNSGPGPCTISVPGIAAQAITVGAMADPGNTVASETPCGPLPAGGFYLACFSSRGPTLDGLMKPDVTAPGVHLMAAYGGFDDPSAPNYPDRYVMVSGTSVAAPFVAGVVALMLQASPSLTPAQVKAAIMDTAVDWGPPGRDNEYGAGILRAYEAIKAVRGGGNAGPLLPNHIMLQGALPAGSSGADCLRTPSAIDYNIYIVDPTVSIAATIVITNWNSNGTVDIDACLFDRSGNLVASSDSPYRQETVGVWSAPSGPYRLRLFTYSGSAPATYTLDISVGGTTVAPGLYMAVDTPPWGQTVKEPFAVAGWALDSRSGAGPGVEYVHVWAYPAQADGVVTGPPRFLGAATLGGSRPDVGNVYGRQYDTSGFNLNATGLPGGYWRLIVYAKSAISGQVIEQHRLVYVPPLAMNVDVPSWRSQVRQPFQVAGWALDQAAANSPGIDYVHVWAYPAQADGMVTGPPRFLGAATLGLSRPDVGAIYGRQYDGAGFSLSATGLSSGYWRLIVYAKSAVNGQVIEQHRLISVPPMAMYVDSPGWGQVVREPFSVAGWALDGGSASSPGIEYVHVWAYPARADGTVTGPPRFLGAATLGGSRPDVGNVYGRQYDTSGFSLNATGLPGGYWRLIVYAKSAISGQVIEQHRLVYVPPMAMNVDVPTWGSRVNRSLSVAGWALDQASCCNAGIEYVHVWAYPALADGRVTGEPPIFLGAGQLALSRPDVAAVYGAQYRSAGFTLSATLPRAGYWRLIVYAKSSISGQVIEQHRLVQAS